MCTWARIVLQCLHVGENSAAKTLQHYPTENRQTNPASRAATHGICATNGNMCARLGPYSKFTGTLSVRA